MRTDWLKMHEGKPRSRGSLDLDILGAEAAILETSRT